MQRGLGPGGTQQQVGQGPRKTKKAKKTPASSLFLDVSLWLGPGCEVCPAGWRRLSPALYTYCQDHCCATHGACLLSAFSGGTTRPGFGQMSSDRGEAA